MVKKSMTIYNILGNNNLCNRILSCWPSQKNCLQSSQVSFIWVVLDSCCLTVQSHLTTSCSCTQSLRRQSGLHVLKLKRPSLV